MPGKKDVGPVVRAVCFPLFRLDLATEQLWRGTELLAIRPKTFAVLRHLVEHPGRLVTRAELCQAVWPQTVGSERAPKQCIRELRDVLGDRVEAPRFIETLGRRGWRFLGNVSRSPQAGDRRPEEKKQRATSKKQQADLEASSRAPSLPRPAPLLVGRGAELARLHALFANARGGERQLVFVTGEPGIGKTALLEAFLDSLASSVQSPESRI